MNTATLTTGMLAGIFFGFLTIYFIYQSISQQRPVKFLLYSGITGFIASIFTVFWALELVNGRASLILRYSYLFGSAIQLIFYYRFIENIYHQKPHRTNLMFVSSFLVLMCIGYISNIIFFEKYNSHTNEFSKYFDLISSWGYNGLGLYIFGIVAMPIYYKVYKKTAENKAFVLMIAVILCALGFLITLIFDGIMSYNPDLFNIYDGVLNIWEFIREIGNFLPVIGLAVYCIVYALNISYIYRLPFEHYFLMVIDKSGLILLLIPFKTKRKVFLQEEMFAGMVTVMDEIYRIIFDSQYYIDKITNKDVSIVVEHGDEIAVLVATERASRILSRGMSMFVKRFENLYEEQIKLKDRDLNHFKSARNLLQQIFPFLQYEENRKIGQIS